MIISISKYTVLLFGGYMIFIGFVMLFAPKKARSTIRKAGSSNLINYSEITIRMILAVALILYADFSKEPIAFKIFGWLMLLTSIVLFFVPRSLHHNFADKSADKLKPIYIQLISPFAFLIGGLLLAYV